jgi:lysophospholipase L1-like esterase
MRQLRRTLPFLLASLAALAGAAGAPAADFPLQDGDVWVMAGDSITAQHLHSNYFEAFCFARYPRIKFAFRNSGVGGHTIPSTLARFDYDIADWKPTVVSVELGMNDSGGTPTDKFVANMAVMVERIRSIKARPVIFTASPVNDGTTMKKLAGRNQRLDEYATALKGFAAKERIPFADQFHDLLDVWGQNKPRESLANALPALKMAAQDDSLAGVEQLRGFLAAQEKDPSRPVSMQGDPVHPGPPGQLMMAAALLKDLSASGEVSSATLDADGKVVEARGCKVEGAKAGDGKLSFDRLDECVAFPIPNEARPVLAIDPTILELSRYTLKVTGLKDRAYQLTINGIPTAKVTARELAAGVNLTAFGPDPRAKQAHPLAAQSKAILDAVAAKEGLVNQWRDLSKQAHAPGAPPALKDKVAAQGEKVLEADARIREAARPQKLHFELSPAGG